MTRSPGPTAAPDYAAHPNAPSPAANLADDAAWVAEIRRRLLDWYGQHRRDLPWRGRTDPYAILVSEIMLQQTGVDRVAQKYDAFLARFSTFQALAEAPRVEVLRAWAGLGYNRRAVNLHECARAVVEQHGGILPRDLKLLRALPGLGPYTVAAISSIAFGEDTAALDTNVRRVIGRLAFGTFPSERAIRAVAAKLVPPGKSSEWNQALMDFGSLQCVAGQPNCRECRLFDLCASAPVGATKKVRSVAEPRPTYSYFGSNRYYRGRIVAVLRELGDGSSIPMADLCRQVKPDCREEEVAWFREVVEGLARDGLARLVATPEGPAVGPPQ
jgi:A/G-specific adenine glycosylase